MILTKLNKTQKNKQIAKKRKKSIKHSRNTTKRNRKSTKNSRITLETTENLPLFQKKIPQKEFINITNNQNLDCCPCVFSALGLGYEDIIKDLQQKATIYKGMYSDDITTQFQHPDYSFHFLDNDKLNYTKSKLLRLIFKKLKNGYGTIGGWLDSGNNRHCILLAKYDNKPLFVDVQQYKNPFAQIPPEKQLIEGLKNIEKHFTDKKKVYVLLARKEDDINSGLIIE